MVDYPGSFAWYELMTTDLVAAETFYRDVVGWAAQDASTPNLAYKLLTAGKVPLGGLIELPEEGRKKGAYPRWMGYLEVTDIELAVDRIKRLGGAVHVPPTNTNIGLISVVADPHNATFGLINGLKPGRRQPVEPGKPGGVGWHELHAVDWEKAFVFYSEVFGWQNGGTEVSPTFAYQWFSVGGQTVGGMFKKLPEDPMPFWLFYFNVEDIDTAAERVRTGGGYVTGDAAELRNGSWVARCVDPQGATFALRGKRSHDARLGWSTEWKGFSSRGRLVAPKRDPEPTSERES